MVVVFALQAMAIVYGQCYEEIGPFNDTAFMVRKLEEVRGLLHCVLILAVLIRGASPTILFIEVS